jgi:hypothetical protein
VWLRGQKRVLKKEGSKRREEERGSKRCNLKFGQEEERQPFFLLAQEPLFSKVKKH